MRFRCLMFSFRMPMAFVTESWSVTATMPFHSEWLILCEKSFKLPVFFSVCRLLLLWNIQGLFALSFFCSWINRMQFSVPERNLHDAFCFFDQSIFSCILPPSSTTTPPLPPPSPPQKNNPVVVSSSWEKSHTCYVLSTWNVLFLLR